MEESEPPEAPAAEPEAPEAAPEHGVLSWREEIIGYHRLKSWLDNCYFVMSMAACESWLEFKMFMIFSICYMFMFVCVKGDMKVDVVVFCFWEG